MRRTLKEPEKLSMRFPKSSFLAFLLLTTPVEEIPQLK
jgi:hypothetical protein